MTRLAFRTAIAAALGSGALGACSTVRDIAGLPDYTVTSASPTSISIRFREGELSKAEGRAADHCAGYSRRSVMQSVAPVGSDSLAVFSCV